MDFSSNRFSIFQADENLEIVNDSEKTMHDELPTKQVTSEPSGSNLDSWKTTNIGAWADAEDDEDDFQPVAEHKPQKTEIKNIPSKTENRSEDPNKQSAIRKLDTELKSRTEIKIPYKTRSFDKETGKFQETTNVRVLRVISQQYYDQLQRLISTFKTHRGPNRDYCDSKEQKAKIKMANELLNFCAKDKNEPCCFVYAVATIHSRDKNGDRKLLVRNEIYPESKCYFECESMTYRFKA
jgi:hypothetical protein